MAFNDDLEAHAKQINVRLPHCTGEEATKHALIVPFLQVLGWDVFNPVEVRPEYDADMATRRGGPKEKVDYAIFLNGQPAILIEAKTAGQELIDHGGQLSRYFNAITSVRVGMITDGARLRVFGDLRQPNIMDKEPWLDVDLRNLTPPAVDALRSLRKSDFETDAVVSLAEEMTYYNAILDFIRENLRDPGDGFIRFVAGEMPNFGRVTQKLVDRLRPVFKKAVQSAIVERVKASFDATGEEPLQSASAAPPPAPEPEATVDETVAASPDGVVTTAEELHCFEVIHGWIREVFPEGPIAYRDSKSYFTIHQENLRRYFIRLGLSDSWNWIAFRNLTPEDVARLAPGFEASAAAVGTRVNLATLDDLGKLRTAVVEEYRAELNRDPNAATQTPAAEGDA